MIIRRIYSGNRIGCVKLYGNSTAVSVKESIPGCQCICAAVGILYGIDLRTEHFIAVAAASVIRPHGSPHGGIEIYVSILIKLNICVCLLYSSLFGVSIMPNAVIVLR